MADCTQDNFKSKSNDCPEYRTVIAETVEKTKGFSDKRIAVCCAHNLPADGGQIPHLQPEKYFLSRTCRERKWLKIYLPPAGVKLCEAF